MAVKYSTKKCESCGGSLEYIREKKVWRCIYCGTEVVRTEEYDGLFTIKNVVRQAIVDAAYRRVKMARSNLSECEKIDTSYVGTLIARICYRFLLAITPGEAGEEEMRGLFARLKNDFSNLRSRGDAMGEDEESLYEFISLADGAADAFAMLLIVFYNLGDNGRAEFFFQTLDLSQVYSKPCNEDLLKYCLKNGKEESARKIIANRDCIDAHTAMDTVLAHCPDGEIKRELIATLMGQGAYSSRDREAVRNYLSGGDSCATKGELIALGKNSGFLPDMHTVIEHVLAPASAEELDRALDGICTNDLRDADLYDVLGFGLSQSAEKAITIVNKLIASGRFVSLNSRMLNQLFQNTAWSPDDRIAVWEAMQPFRTDDRAVDMAMADYLLYGSEAPATRGQILYALMKRAKAVSPAVLEQYLLNCSLDSSNKAGVITDLFSLENMHPALFSSALGKYISTSPDDPKTSEKVVNSLIAQGLTIEPKAITQIVVSQKSDAAEKIEMLRRLAKNGSNPPADALSIYLEQCISDFSYDMFSYLFDKATKISDLAIKNYVLFSEDLGGVKVGNAATLASINGMPLGTSPCTIRCLDREISCGLAQAYLLAGQDSFETSAQMLQIMGRECRINSDIRVNGSSISLKKFMKENKSALPPRAVQLGEIHRLFSLF